ncbi:MAG TPA: cupin domain-containing protein, partial [Vicinamibacterales bacterium]|nr:cupin domain-containing protein [Vicinamibacterales bacterium]
MRRIAVLLSLSLIFAASVRWIDAQQPPAAGDDPHFTGKSVPMDGKDLTVARRHFEAGARSAWHTHDNGQLLLVEKGRMRTQKRGRSVRELGVGESDYTPPNMQHWHGATPGQELVQINVGFGGATKW